MGLFSTSTSKICIYPGCNSKKEGRSFECCPDHHCAHFRTSITCYNAKTTTSTACKTHTCNYRDGACKSPIEGPDTRRCRDHRPAPSPSPSVKSNGSAGSYYGSDDEARSDDEALSQADSTDR
jgi:hypothetical protein